MKTVREMFNRMRPGSNKDLIAHAVEQGFVRWEDPYSWDTYHRLKIYIRRHSSAKQRANKWGIAA